MRIVFSPAKGRPGCILLQAVMGGDVPSETFYRLFPSDTWLTATTDDMRAYTVDEEHPLEWLSKVAQEAMRVSRGAA